MLRIVFLFFFCVSSAALASESMGPSLSYESGGSRSSSHDGIRSTQGAHSRLFFQGFAPLPDFYGSPILVGQYAHDEDSGQSTLVRSASRDFLSLGIIYLPRVNFHGVSPLVTYSYLTDPRFRHAPVHEVYLGVTASSLPLKFNDHDEVSSSLLLRIRRFPHFQRFLPILLYKLETASSYLIDIGIPSQVILGYHPNSDQLLTAGLRADARDGPSTLEDSSSWFDGYALNILVGFRQRLWSFLHLSVEAGVQREVVSLVSRTRNSHTISEFGFGPWVNFGLQTVFEETPQGEGSH